MSYPQEWAPKYLIEALSSQQTYAPDKHTSEAMQALLGVLFLHRPVGSNGKHGDLHTPTCGCDYVGFGDD